MDAKLIDQILSDMEKNAVATFVANPVMAEAVRKVLLAGVYYNGTLEAGKPADPSLNFALQWPFSIDMQNADVSNEHIGQDVRASVRGIRMIEMAFKQMTNVTPVSESPKKKEKVNRGR